MLVVLSLGWATLQCGRFLLPPLLPRITEALAFSPAGIGAALTGFGLVYAAVQYPSGTYSDALSRATLILPGFLVLLAGFLAVALSVTAAFFVGAVLVLAARESRPALVVLNRVKPHTIIYRELRGFLGDYKAPIVGQLRDSMNYVRAFESGLSVSDYPPYLAEQDWDEWATILEWITSRKSRGKA